MTAVTCADCSYMCMWQSFWANRKNFVVLRNLWQINCTIHVYYIRNRIAAKNTFNIEQGTVILMALPVTNVPPINPNPGEEPSQIQIQCNNCHELVTSSVESSLRAQGWGFAICCLFSAQFPGVLPPGLQTIHPLLPTVQCPPVDRQARPLQRSHRPPHHPKSHHDRRGYRNPILNHIFNKSWTWWILN